MDRWQVFLVPTVELELLLAGVRGWLIDFEV